MKHHLAILIVALLAVLAYGQSQVLVPPGSPIAPSQPQGMIDPRDFVYLTAPGGSQPQVIGRNTLPYTVPTGRILVIRQLVVPYDNPFGGQHVEITVNGQSAWNAHVSAPTPPLSPGLSIAGGTVVDAESPGGFNNTVVAILGYLVDA